MKFSEIKENVKNVALAGYVPFVRGLHGIGKSEMMESVAGEIGEALGKDVVFHAIDVAHIKEGELTGMPVTGVDKETGCTVNTYTVYNVFNEVIAEAKQGYVPVIFFDEINRTDRVVFNELMPIILNKRVQETYLPEETVILTAGNPEDISKYKGASDDYAVLPMDPALKDRLFMFELDVDPVEWLRWATKDDHVDSDIVEYITEYPNMLHFLSNNELNPTPRGWTMLSKVYKIIKKGKTSLDEYEDNLITTASGKIGRDTALNFVRFMRENKNPLLKVADFFGETVSDDLFNQNLAKLKNETPTRQYVTMANLTSYYIKQLSTDEIKKSKPKKTALTGRFFECLMSLPNDITIGTIIDIKNESKLALTEIVKYDPKRIIGIQKYLV